MTFCYSNTTPQGGSEKHSTLSQDAFSQHVKLGCQNWSLCQHVFRRRRRKQCICAYGHCMRCFKHTFLATNWTTNYLILMPDKAIGPKIWLSYFSPTLYFPYVGPFKGFKRWLLLEKYLASKIKRHDFLLQTLLTTLKKAPCVRGWKRILGFRTNSL